jgi:hypothetical protein
MIDGARIASPGMLYLTLAALQRFDRPIVATVGFHLGPDLQSRSLQRGYNKRLEDDLLESIDWKHNGYRLFEVSALAGSSKYGWFGPMAESNFIAMPRSMFNELKGFKERFDFPGGGLLNLDFYKRACELKETTLVSLLGEGTFHQVHGGVMTSRTEEDMAKEFARYAEQYRQIRGVPFEIPPRVPSLLGTYRKELREALGKMLENVS